jgi:AmmeMemoRadiSam system protein A
MSAQRSTTMAASDLEPRDRAALLALARHAIATALGRTAGAPEPRAVFDRVCGAFVSVHVDGALRGCIGMPEPAEPLRDVVTHCARAAALEDPRFAPIEAAEIGRLAIEVSVLTPLARLADASAVEVGRHGLVVEQGWRRGLLLPQVATEHGWNAVEFLRHTCLKAGLPTDAWQRGATLWTFEAVVFSDERSATAE